MDVAALLTDLFDRVPPLASHAVDGLPAETLVARPGEGANTIAWLVWHQARVQDSHIAELIDGGSPQLYVTDDWGPKFGLASDPHDTGYGYSADEVLSVRPESGEALVSYTEAVGARTRDWLASVTPADLDEIVDRNWDPPVTLGVRLISVADDCLEHLGQAAYARGLLT